MDGFVISFYFTHGEDDQLLHYKLKTNCEMAMVARGAKFYRPDEVPDEENNSLLEPIKVAEIRRLHEYCSHPSCDKKMKRMVSKWFEDF